MFEFSAQHLTKAVSAQATRSIIDTIGVSIAGVDHENARLSRQLANDTYAEGVCHVFGQKTTFTAPGAAFCNGVAAHVLDFDDVSYEGMVHASAVVWPAVQAAAELTNATGQQVMIAFVAAVEAEYALGRAMTHDLFWRGWWTTGLLGSIGAAMGAAKVLQLDKQAIIQAINIAACQATGPYVVVGSPIKSYASGRAAEAGVLAALAAQRGLVGPAQTFEHENGFVAMYGENQSVPEELDKLGTRFVLETSKATFKRYPVCAAGQSPVEALQNILSQNAFSGYDIVSVDCEVTSDVAHYMAIERAGNITEAQFCLPFCLACVLCFGELGPQHLAMEVINDPLIIATMSNINVTYSKELDRLCKQDERYQNAAQVTAITCAGVTITELIPAPTGLPLNPMSNSQIEEKFLSCVSGEMDDEIAGALLSRIKSLNELQNIRQLF